jgi:DNA-binding transcriptional ArsR family regulator
MNKSKSFDDQLQSLASFAKVISHPARLAILQYLSETKTCISGDISEKIPLSRTTVSQHLNTLKKQGLIHGEIEGLKVNYCLCKATIAGYKILLNTFFEKMESAEIICN